MGEDGAVVNLSWLGPSTSVELLSVVSGVGLCDDLCVCTVAVGSVGAPASRIEGRSGERGSNEPALTAVELVL